MQTIINTMLEQHRAALCEFERNSGILIPISERLIKAIKSGCRLYLCGNGGSAADCQHIAAEFVGRFRKERPALPAVALSTDTSILTSIGNDYGFDEIFARQVEGLVRPGDILWVLSTSGTSRNILNAVKVAQSKQAFILSFTGKKDSILEAESDLCFCIHTAYTSIAQEMHLLAYHIICELVDNYFAGHNVSPISPQPEKTKPDTG